MQIIHPQGMRNGIPSEDYFIVVDDMATELGSGYIVLQYQPHLYPDCPVNLYFHMEGQPVSCYMLFGALIARARQLRDVYHGVPARVYTNVNPADTQLRDFYVASGLGLNDTEDVVELAMPLGNGTIPMSCTVAAVPLNTPMDVDTFLERMAQNDVNYLNAQMLQGMMQQPHFIALGLYHNTDLIGEVLMVGQGDTADLVAMYIVPAWRRNKMGQTLLHRAMAVMAAEGVVRVRTRLMSRSEPQKRLFAHFGAQIVATGMNYPGLYL